MKKLESTNKLERKKNGPIFPKRPDLKRAESSGQKPEKYYRHICAENFPNILESIFDKTNFSSFVNIPQTANIFNHLHQNYGNAFLKNGIQAKFKIGKSDNFYEQEADRVADAVIRMPDPHRQKQTEDKNEPIQKKTASSHITLIIQNNQSVDQSLLAKNCLESRIQNLKNRGQPLSKSVRTFFESRFNTDFSKVRIHTGIQAAETAHGLNSQAFTLGNNIVFGAGLYAPETVAGKKLLAHELTHVMQQRGNDLITIRRNGEVPPTGPRPELPVPTERIYIIWPPEEQSGYIIWPFSEPPATFLKAAINYFKNLLNKEVHIVPSVTAIFDDLYDVGFMENIQVNRLIIAGHSSTHIEPPPKEISGYISVHPPDKEKTSRYVGAEEVKQFVLSNPRAEAVREYVMAKGAVVEFWGCFIGESRTFMETMSETFKTEFRAPTGTVFFYTKKCFRPLTTEEYANLPSEKKNNVVYYAGGWDLITGWNRDKYSKFHYWIPITDSEELNELPKEIQDEYKQLFKFFLLRNYKQLISSGEISETKPPRNEYQRFLYMKDLFNRCGGMLPLSGIKTSKGEEIRPFPEKIQEWYKLWEISFPPGKKK